jgi:hypothetical protein
MKRVTTTLSLVTLILAAACEPSSDPAGGSPSPAPGSYDPPGASSPPPAPAEEPACVAPTGGPTMHKGDIAADQVWTAAGSPHIVEYDVTVRNGAKLTIEPCAEVRVMAGRHLHVAYPGTPNKGSLEAIGTAKRPIRIHGKDGARWASLHVYSPGTARLAYVDFSDGGGGDFENGSTLYVRGAAEGADALVSVDHVTVKGSLGSGVWLEGGAAFAAGSKELSVTGSGKYPIELSEHALDTLPDGALTGNATDEILVAPEGGRTAGSGFLADSTIHARSVPYHVGRSIGSSLVIGGRTDGKLVTVSVEPGVVMRFAKGGALKVQHFTSDKPSTGALRAIGTADKPIVLTSAAAAPAPGDWLGVWFGGVPQPTNAIEHARIEYAGGDCGCILLTCSAITEHEGAIILTAQPPGAFVKNTTFLGIAGHGISEGYQGAFVDFRPTNTFEVSGCPQTRPRETSTACPSPLPACD